jgi:plastocyanin
MNRVRGAAILVLAVLAVSFSLAWIGCSSKNNSSNYPTAPSTGGTAFNFGPFAVSQSASKTFTTAGTFGYHCIPHAPGMAGTVQVDAGGADSVLVEIGLSNALTFTPSTAHIKPNGVVRWVNKSSMTIHTVTSN